MRILVTGGAGFIGSHVVDCYIENGHEVFVLDNLSSGKKENINPKARFFNVDVTDAKKVAEVFDFVKPDVVNHHAAQIDVRKSVNDPKYDATVNIIGIINLLECSRKTGVRKFIFASSGGTIYGECGSTPPDENSKSSPMSPYGVSKLTSEFYLKYYSATFGIKFTSLRYANVYGPRQDPHGEAGVVAIFSNRLLNDEEVFIYGDGKQMRDYVYVEDVVKANLLSLSLADDEVVNIGTSLTTSVLELYEAMIKILPSSSKKPVFKPPRTGELFKSYLSIEKAKRILNWSPTTSLSDGLAKTIDYFRERKVSKSPQINTESPQK